MEVGHLVKKAGLRSDVIGSAHHVVVRWQDGGVRGLMNGLIKNAYAGLNYYIYGHRLKLMAGAEYSKLDGGSDGGAYEGWTAFSGIRMFF